MSDLPGIDEALALVLARVQALPLEDVPVGSAAGRVLGEDARAFTDLPPFDSSAMDGYAVRAADTPGPLRVVGHSAAGHPAPTALGPGEAVVISTGAVVPEGADAVVPVERTTGDVVVEAVGRGTTSGHVAATRAPVRSSCPPAAHSGRPGLSARGGGDRRRPLRPPPTCGGAGDGSELRAPGTPLAPGEIYESNSVLIAAQLASAGAVATVFPVVADDEAATRAALEGALEQDMLITSGGVSVGPHDLVRATLAELGAEEVFWRVAVKPGKPIAFAVRGASLVFGLPGNPVSSLVGFELFVRPALRALQGARDPGPEFLPGQLAAAVRRTADRDELVRAHRTGDRLAPLDGQDSHMIVRAAGANALVLVPRGSGELPQGVAVVYLQI